MSATRANLIVCVPTFKRPSTLRQLLNALGRQSVIGEPGIDLKVAVLDNDPAQSARIVAQEFTALAVEYIPVPQPGLAAVRNAAIRAAERDADFLVFIDDDMEPCATWIAAFLEAYRRTSASILCGSQIPSFPSGSRKWIVEGGFFAEDPVEDLSELRYGNSGNTFLDCALFRRYALRFDPAFSFTGGEDTVFFARLRAAGEKILRVRSALVKDLLTEQRVTPGFLLSRAFRHGGTLLIADAVAGGWLQAAPVHLGKALARLMQAPFVVLGAPARKASWLKSGMKIAKSAGTAAAMLGFQIRPYAYGRKMMPPGASERFSGPYAEQGEVVGADGEVFSLGGEGNRPRRPSWLPAGAAGLMNMQNLKSSQQNGREDRQGAAFRLIGARSGEGAAGLAVPLGERAAAIARSPACPRSRSASALAGAHRLRVLAWPIDPLNPYTTALYSGMGPGVRVDEFTAGKLIHRYGVWHVHWPEALLNIRRPALAALKISSFLAMIDLVKLRGGKIVWTVHNLKAHDGLHPVLEEWFWRRFIPRVDGVISLSETGLAMAGEKFPRLRHLPSAVIPHGHYRDQYPEYTEDARAALGIAAHARVFLYFGEIRPYKNVDALVRAFRQTGDAKALLLVAGRAKNASLAESLRKEASADSRIRLELAFIARERVAKFFAAADLVVLPYRRILNSGAALLALSFSRPVLVPDLGSMGNLKDDFGGGWVRTFPGEIDARTLESAMSWTAQPRPALCPMPEDYRWDRIRSRTLNFYSGVMGA